MKEKTIIKKGLAHVLSVLMLMSVVLTGLTTFGMTESQEAYADSANQPSVGQAVLTIGIDNTGYSNYSNKYIVIDVDGDYSLLLSDALWKGDGTDSSAYTPFGDESTWAGSEAAAWCEIYNQKILSQINGIELRGTYSDVLNGDLVFYLSEDEATTYLTTEDLKKAKLGSDYQNWWLRTPDATDSTKVKIINSNGAVASVKSTTTQLANRYFYSPRPAFWADFSESCAKLSGSNWVVYKSHVLGDVVYTWANDCSECTAEAVCSQCGKTVTETVSATSTITTPASCEAKGKTTYTATFTNEAFAEQTKEEENIDALDHAWDEGVVDKEPTESETGIMKFTCSRCQATRTEVIPKLEPTKPEMLVIDRDGEENQPAAGGEYTWTAVDSSYMTALDGLVTAEDFTLKTKKQADNEWANSAVGSLSVEALALPGDEEGKPSGLKITATIPDNTDDYDKCWSIVYGDSEGTPTPATCASIQYVQLAAEAQPADKPVLGIEPDNVSIPVEGGECSWYVFDPDGNDLELAAEDFTVQMNAGETWTDTEIVPSFEIGDNDDDATVKFTAEANELQVEKKWRLVYEGGFVEYDGQRVVPCDCPAITQAAKESEPAADPAVEAVKEKIDALPAAADVKVEDKEAIEAARAAYDELTPEQQAEINDATLQKLTDAEAALKAAEEAGNNPAPAPAPAPAVTQATVNAKTASAAAIQQAIQAAGGNVDTLVLGKSVKKISKNALKGTSIKTIVVQTKKFKKKSVKGSLKGSSVTTVKVQVGKAKTNKKYVKKYKKFFTKKNAGKKAKVSKF